MGRKSGITLLLLLLSAGFALTACKGKALVRQDGLTKEEASGAAEKSDEAASREGAGDTVLIPEDRVLSEDAAAANSMSKEGVAGASLAAGTDGEALSTVHFDFDRYFIRNEDRPLLERNAGWLKKNPSTKVQIEGHADERGDNEYNLALGDRRADSAKRFLVDMGIGEDRLPTISYGEEKPVAQGTDDDAWSRNRRAEFRVE